jgi:hypothetical protein
MLLLYVNNIETSGDLSSYSAKIFHKMMERLCILSVCPVSEVRTGGTTAGFCQFLGMVSLQGARIGIWKECNEELQV